MQVCDAICVSSFLSCLCIQIIYSQKIVRQILYYVNFTEEIMKTQIPQSHIILKWQDQV